VSVCVCVCMSVCVCVCVRVCLCVCVCTLDIRLLSYLKCVKGCASDASPGRCRPYKVWNDYEALHQQPMLFTSALPFSCTGSFPIR
jgi:hypothetical protein